MADVTNFKIGENVYNVKDATARSTASAARTAAEGAQSTASAAQTAAEGAQSTASAAQKTANNAKTIALGAYPVYTSADESIEFESKPEV